MNNTHVIGDYTAALTIDGSTNYLLIQPGDSSTAYRKINRNVLLGVTGQPADVSTSQTFTNKVLGNTNTITVKDTGFTLQDDADTTKQAQFQLSGITTATTRTYALPNASSTLADTSTAQTFTNKTLTGPTITGGSIDNSTITVDSIAGHTTANTGTIYGLSIASGKVGTNGVVTASITDSAVTPAKLLSGTGSSWSWQSWTPTFANWTIGTGGLAGTTARFIEIGKTVHFYITSTLGTSGQSVGTNATFTLPVPASAAQSAPTDASIGNLNANVAGTNYSGFVWCFTSTMGLLIFQNTAATFANTSGSASSTPGVWAAGNHFTAQGTYEAA